MAIKHTAIGQAVKYPNVGAGCPSRKIYRVKFKSAAYAHKFWGFKASTHLYFANIADDSFLTGSRILINESVAKLNEAKLP